MMTIKIISADGTKTTIYSAKWVQRRTLGYSNYSDFKALHDASEVPVNDFMMWPQQDSPTNLPKSDDKTEFQELFFANNENNEQVLFLEHCNVYIMEGGQTVDSFRC
jgi:hypothetical protein